MVRNTTAVWGWPAKLLDWGHCDPRASRPWRMDEGVKGSPMKCTTIVAALVVAGCWLAQDAAAEPAATPKGAYAPGVAEIMIMTQIRHGKLWLAGAARHWDLADYQIDELKEGLEDIVKYFPTYKEMPVGSMIEATVMAPIADVESAIKARDRARFAAAYDKLTAACNACHQSAKRPFIVIQRPATSTYPNQSFAPKP